MINKLAVAALVLWAVTAAVIAIVFVRGDTATASDGRISVLLAPNERDFVLAEMRIMLTAVQEITEALAEDKPADAAQAARTAGGKAAAAVPLPLMAKLPMEFKEAGMAMHNGFDDIATAADHGERGSALTSRLAAQIAACVGCHASYRIDPNR